MKKIFIALIFYFIFSADVYCANLDEMIGQMIIVGYHGDNVESEGFKTILKQINNNQISGVILFEHNIKDKKNLIEMTKKIKTTNSKYIPFISIDQEGGYVQRLNKKNGFKDYPTFQSVSNMTIKNASEIYNEMAFELYQSGFNLNFTPCVDLSTNKDSIISKKERSFSNDYNKVIDYSKIVINEHKKYNVITTLKHFPGHGSAIGDTHLGFVDATSTWNKNELQPYISLLKYNPNQMVMVAHTFNGNFDSQYPSSLSKKTINGYLRKKLKFNGVVITDDLDMLAIKNNYTLDETVINAINAGVNILLFCNFKEDNPQLPEKIHNIIINAINEGKIDKNDIKVSYNKILKLKNMKGKSKD